MFNQFHFPAKIGSKITLIAIGPMLVALGMIFATLMVEQRQLQSEVRQTIEQQGFNEAANVAKSVYLLCAASESHNRKELTHSLSIAHEIVQRAGGINLTDESVAWRAVNQLTKSSVDVTLPKVLAGTEWLGQVSTTDARVKIVDDAKHLTGNFCTVFQRMNEEGDMLRVATSVLKDDKTRALGTYIPVIGPDGTSSAVIQTVLRGNTYLGRALW